MNYYLARAGQTYGPYPQESFPAMFAAGQVVPQDMVCPEGGTEWVPASQVPELASPSSSAAAPAPAGNKLRISGIATAAHSSATPAAAAATPAANYPKATYESDKKQTGLMEKAAGAWGLLRIVGGAAVVIIVVASLVVGYVRSQGDKKEIAKLHSQPGWSAFNAGNSQINSESSTAGYGNNSEAQRFAQALALAVESVQKEDFPIKKTSRYRGRSKLGRVTSAVSSATAGSGKVQTYVEKRDDRLLVLIHVPEFSRYSSGTRKELAEACWDTTRQGLAELMKMRDQLQAQAKAATTPGTAPASRPPSGRPAPGQPTATAPPSAVKPAERKPPKELALVVGVRGKSSYECVYVAKVDDAPDSTVEPARKNVPSHVLLVKWFGEEKP